MELISSQIEKSQLFRYIQKNDQSAEELRVKIFVATSFLLVALAKKDNYFHMKEIKFIKRYLKEIKPSPKILIINVIDSIVDEITNNKKLNVEDLEDKYIQFLSINLQENEKKKLLEILFTLSRADLEYTQEEDDFIKMIAQKFQIDDQLFSDIKNQCQSTIDNLKLQPLELYGPGEFNWRKSMR